MHDPPRTMIRPAALRPGARIALVAPAGPLAEGAAERAVQRVEAMGWIPRLGEHASGRHGYLAGTDDQRLADLNRALRSDDIDTIWCLRGGYGTMRILDRIDWPALQRRPRALIGFSDNTALHLALQRLGVVSFHGPHPAADYPPFAEQALRAVVTEARPAGLLPAPPAAPAPEAIVGGRAEGLLVGGNLALLAATLGTPYAVQTSGAILFLEEVGEPVYRIDRLLSQLLLAGVLDRVAGIVIGAFSECPDLDKPELPSTAEVLRDRLAHLRVPVAAGFSFGHIPDNLTLPLGVLARLDADAGTLELLEPAVSE
jgi:muramoyltetrapeptide carboxypeptidase